MEKGHLPRSDFMAHGINRPQVFLLVIEYFPIKTLESQLMDIVQPQ